MVGDLQENDMSEAEKNPTTSADGVSTTFGPISSGQQNSSSAHRAPLPLRIGVAVIAALLLVTGVVAACNALAINTYNQATQNLTSNISAAKKSTADLSKLKASQEQTDSQYADAQAFSAVLLPSAKSSIQQNAATSKELTALIDKALKEQQSSSKSSDGSEAETDKKSNSSETSGLSQEEREKVQELLKQNQATQTPSPSASSSSSNTSTNENVKPW
jgi:hypothetical protein